MGLPAESTAAVTCLQYCCQAGEYIKYSSTWTAALLVNKLMSLASSYASPVQTECVERFIRVWQVVVVVAVADAAVVSWAFVALRWAQEGWRWECTRAVEEWSTDSRLLTDRA